MIIIHDYAELHLVVDD